MSEEMLEFWEYFPIQIEPELRGYIDHHISHLQKCCENGLYSSAYPHLHILYMAFAYFQLFRIAKDKKVSFRHSLIGFSNIEKKILGRDSPLSFCHINEKPVFRFFRLVDFDDSTIDNISGIVEDRNDTLHASGKIMCQTESELEKQVNIYRSKMALIVKKQNKFLNKIYHEILDTFEDGYVVTSDDVLLSFGSFSEFELKILTTNKNDEISKYIQKEYLGIDNNS